MTEKRLSAAEFIRQQKADPMKAPVERATVSKVLKILAPAFGFAPKNINRIWDACGGQDLLNSVRQDPEVGAFVPAGLVIGGVRGVTYGDILALNISEKPFFRKFLGHVSEFGDAAMVFPIKGAGYWVIHNLTVPPGRRLHAVEVYAKRAGLKHIQIINIVNFVKEFIDERDSED